MLLPFYTFTMGLSALLMFWVQPLFARMALPLLGGAPAVWITAMLFFQAALLAGYLYAHLSVRWLGLKRQSLLHALVLLAAFVALPIAIPAGWTPPAGEMPVGWLIGLFAVGVGLPFFAISATAPLLQRWFAHTGHAGSADPYFLYGASNIGSIAALIGYPLLAEPSMRLGQQSVAWAGAYGALVLLIGLCGVLLWRNFTATSARGSEGELELSPEITWRRRLTWIALAFAPSSLMLGVTLHISTDLAAVPLLWVVPLTLYLLSFVLVFARRRLLPHKWMLFVQPLLLILLALSMSWNFGGLWGEIPIHLLAFFVTAMVCHGELAARRPAAVHLTEFYLWMAVGGVLGGAFNAVAAPLLFESVLEYPLAIAFVCVLRPWRGIGGRKALALDILLPGLLALVVLIGGWAFVLGSGEWGETATYAAFTIAAIASLAFARQDRPLRFALAMSVLLAAGPLLLGEPGLAGSDGSYTVLWKRSFFGVNRVAFRSGIPPTHVLINGTTVHGAQFLDPARRREPLTYYHRDGPLGQVFRAFGPGFFHNVGVVGLGTGAAACYARPGEEWTFFEIDPAVEKIARDGRWFTYLEDCAPWARVVIGDARLSLVAVPDKTFDLLVIDAFSSDAIPVHLLTREAFLLYRRKLAPSGVLMVHISNEFMDLEPVIGRISAETLLFGVVQYYEETESRATGQLGYGSIWSVMARRPDDILPLAPDERWQPLRGRNAPLWTDDYVNLVGALRPLFKDEP